VVVCLRPGCAGVLRGVGASGRTSIVTEPPERIPSQTNEEKGASPNARCIGGEVTANTVRSTKASWLTEPEHPEPAHPEPQFVEASAKVQALARHAEQRGFKVVSREEFDRLPGPRMTLGQHDRLTARWRSSHTPHRGRTPRVACNTRTRGSRRGAATSSRAGPGDGESDLDGDSDPDPPRRRAIAPALIGGWR
jgi:hypothetical protein